MHVAKRYSLEFWISGLVVLAMMFPYSPILISSSTQPVAPAILLLLSLASIFKVINNPVVDKLVFRLCLLFLLMCFIQIGKLLWYPFDALLLLKYFTALSFFWFGSKYLIRIKPLTLNFYLFIWALGATIQLIFPGLLLSLVSGQEISSAGRGTASFAPEPAFFATHIGMCYLITLYKFLVKEAETRDLFYSLVLVIYSLLISQAATGVIIAIFCMTLFLLRNGNLAFTKMFLIGVTLSAILIFMPLLLEGKRIFEIFTFFSSANFLGDQSLATRFFHIALGVNVLLEMKLFGYSSMLFANIGLDMFDYIPSLIYDMSLVIDPVTNGSIHSLFSNLVIDFGLVFVPIILVVLLKIIKNISIWNDGMVFQVTLYFFLFLLLLLPIPVGSPIFFSIIGLYSQSPLQSRY